MFQSSFTYNYHTSQHQDRTRTAPGMTRDVLARKIEHWSGVSPEWTGLGQKSHTSLETPWDLCTPGTNTGHSIAGASVMRMIQRTNPIYTSQQHFIKDTCGYHARSRSSWSDNRPPVSRPRAKTEKGAIRHALPFREQRVTGQRLIAKR